MYLHGVRETSRFAQEVPTSSATVTTHLLDSDPHSNRARWLHDVVLSEVRLTILRLENSAASPAKVLDELHQLDYRLRAHHLSEAIAADGATLGEVLQVQVRRLQAAGIHIGLLPPSCVTSVVLGARDASTTNHVVSVLVSNSLNAAASQVSLSASISAESIELTVTDDAGGFRLDEVPDGRALTRLQRDPQILQIGRSDVPHGSSVAVTILRDNVDTIPVSA